MFGVSDRAEALSLQLFYEYAGEGDNGAVRAEALTAH